MAVDVSICAVTYRRPEGLARLLESLARLKLPEAMTAEIVLVDNDPAGGAYRDPERAEVAGSLPVRWHFEGAGDIARARNRCVREAAGHWIAFIDDDEAAHEGWIAAYAWLANEVEADGFFGPVLPRLEVERDHWLDVETFYRRPRMATGTVVRRLGACTANAFLRRELLRRVPFDSGFGTTGGEDTEAFLRAREQGAHFVWCDEARVDDFIPPERHRPGFLVRRAFEQGASWSRIAAARSRRSPTAELAGAIARVIGAVLALPCAALLGRRAAFGAWLRLCTQRGRLAGLRGWRGARRDR